jgi:ectoine hydroxylase-related dioxygenase (phytanoyl-CoA dioxygenase family)
MMGLALTPTTIHEYDVGVFDFGRLVAEALRIDQLAEAHNTSGDYEIFSRETDQSSVFHARFYDWFRESDAFTQLYRRFIATVITPLIGEELVFQRIPNLRVHLPGNVAVGEFHRDADYHHGGEEVNFWTALTDAHDTNTIWIESEPDKGDFQPMDLHYGQVLMFDGVHLRHGNKTNETGRTRVSFDFRVIPRSRYHDRSETTVNAGMRFVVGEYFDVVD